ncbi:Tfp pilus assembly protein FimT/FimU, partial [Planctomycetota bacterium]
MTVAKQVSVARHWKEAPERPEWRVGEVDPLSGFTLVELLVVIAIIMVLAVASVPALNAFARGQKLDGAARIVQSALNDIRRRAITKHTRHVVVLYSYDEGGEGLSRIRHGIAVYSGPVGRKNDKGYFEGGYVGKPLVLPSGIRFAQDSMSVRLWQAVDARKPGEPLPLESPYFRKRNREALAFRADGTIADRDDISGTHPPAHGDVNVFLREEGYYQIP